MKILSTLVLFGLIIIPIITRTIYLPILALSRKQGQQAQPKTPSISKTPKATLGLVTVYFLLMFGAFIWFFTEVIAPFIDIGQKELVLGLILLIALAVCVIVPLYYYWKYSRKVNPMPKEGFTPQTRLEWYNKQFKIYVNIVLKRLLPIIVGISILVTSIWAVAVYFLTK